MRPHRLTLTAFGPFAGTVEVDLDALSGAGVFLLHGETGAGKTTLLDGLGFALYGRVPGERGKAKRLRSDHAPDAVRTSVELELTLCGRRMRILRSPQQDKPSSRGGLTTVPAKVQLDELAGASWHNVSTRVGEADAEIADLMGMSAEQFFQVVLLPQGEFATFLRADSGERGRLLQRLFGTDRFRDVEDWLAERRRATATQVEAADEEVRVLAARLAQAGSVPAPADVPLPWAAAVAADLRSVARCRREVEAERRGQLTTARRAADEAVVLSGRQARRRHAVTRQERVERERPAVDLARAQLAAAVRASAVVPLLAEAARRERVVSTCAQAEARAFAVLPDLADPLPLVLDRERTRIGRLEALRDVASAVQADTLLAESARSEAEEAGRASSSARAALDALPARRAELERALRAARSCAARLPVVEANLVTGRTAVDDARALVGARAACALHRDELTLARESAVSLQEKVVDIREARVDSMIAELAATLEEGAPCPVCGAVDHPEPSLLVGARVTRDDEDRAQTAYDAARQDAEQAAAALAAAEATAAALAGRLRAAGGGSSVDAVTAALDLLVAEHTTLSEGAATEAADDAALAELEASRAAWELARVGAEGERAAALRRAGEAQVRADAARTRLAAELEGVAPSPEGPPDLDVALLGCASLVTSVENALLCTQATVRAGAELAEAARHLAECADRAGFDGPEDAAAAMRDVRWQEETASRLREAEADAVAVATQLADPELAVALEPLADVPTTRAALLAASVAHDAAAAELATAVAAADAVDALVPLLTDALDALTPLAARAAEVRRLADLVAGTSPSNTLRMSLSSFVLAARLEEVALAASERLLRMTQGRYSLVHTDAGRGGGRAGLGLLARDTWTGQDRETSTLSGGETFLASLALALGLADVVAAEAGGARIEALFVDEGFGTLDEETLDEVMDVLDGLREGGRVVGLVSHVGELRQRVPAQVHVRKGRTGSDLLVLGC